jgi:hypothetical protein
LSGGIMLYRVTVILVGLVKAAKLVIVHTLAASVHEIVEPEALESPLT